MKKILLFTAITVMAVFTTGCETSMLAKIGMDTDDAAEKVAQVYSNHIDTSLYKPVRIMWSETEEAANDLGYISVDMVGKDGEAYNQYFEMYEDHLRPKPIEKSTYYKGSYDFDAIHWLGPEDVDFKLIKTHYDKAKAEIPESGEYKFKAIENYEIKISMEQGGKSFMFTMAIVEKTKKYSIKKGYIEPKEYDMIYKGFADGSVEYIDVEE